MANIILPTVPILSSIDNNSNWIIEQGEEIYRFPIPQDINANTLDGYDSSYFATAQQINDLNSTINNLTNKEDLLYTGNTDNGIGSFNTGIQKSVIEQYKHIEIICWTYQDGVGWWYEPLQKIKVKQLSDAFDNDGLGVLMSHYPVGRAAYFYNDYLWFSDGILLTDGSSYSVGLVPEFIYGIKE